MVENKPGKHFIFEFRISACSQPQAARSKPHQRGRMLHSEPGQLEPTQPAFEESQRKKGQGTLEVERFFGELVQREREQENQSQHRATAQESEVSAKDTNY